MSRVLKSSQIILDNDKFKLPLSIPIRKEPIKSVEENDEEKVKENLEVIVAEKMKEMDELYQNARLEADKIISDAYEKSNAVMEQARQDGFSEGRNEGFEEGKNLADSIIQEALTIKRQVEADTKSAAIRLEEDVVKLTISTIEKILNKTIEEDQGIIQSLVHLGLEKCAYTEDLTLRVSPDDYDFAISIKDKILVLSQNINDIVIKQDKSLAKGSCILDSEAGSVDSGIWTQFSQVKEMFEELLRSE
ncbi:FliH/SctL family protein [Wukongibacter baidiensis]|uniref:FliH/SctL family protein n=1 Tax=Wukongibacter baidiensis TaxID=1723361 RepID=UPI003D7FFD8D